LKDVLHVANGHATMRLIELSGVPGRTMVWCDPLHDGPVPGGVSDDELVRVRAAFLAASADDVDGVVADLRHWRGAIDQQDYGELVLWYEHDLFDQLNLIQILAHLGQSRPSRPITLVSIDSFPGHPDFKGIGELEPEDLPVLFQGRQPIGDAQIGLGSRAWTAYRSTDPRAIEELLRADTSALPFLAGALRRHLEEFPSAENGLSRSEQRVMAQAIGGPVDLRTAWPRAVDGERWFYLTDSGFVDRTEALANSSPALVTLRPRREDERSFPAGELELTESGRDVLAGAADRLRLCGIDRWLGGVHLNGRGPSWRWNAAQGCVTIE
jgi:hypothetical protein